MLRSDCSREFHAAVVPPIIARFCSGAGKCPEANTLAIHAKQVRDTADGPVWVGAQSGRAVEQVLCGIIGRISDEWLRVDHQPRLPLGSKNVARMQVRCQQHLNRCSARQFLKKA